MPYSVGEKGSYGCSGYPAVKEDGEVMGCHSTKEEAEAQIYAINQSEGNIGKSMYSIRENVTGCSGYAVVDEDGELDGCFATRSEAEAYLRTENQDDMSEDDIDEKDTVTNNGGMGIKDPDYWPVSKSNPCWEGYTQRGMKPGDNGRMVPNCVPVAKADDIFEDDDDVEYDDDMSKAETFTPNAGMKAAARRALKWKEDGKATGAGTPVGWGRASDIVAGRAMSLSTVRRMFSFFSRHEAASKGGKDFNNTSNPSNGRIMWDAWGGNAGFAWSRAIVNRMKDKALFADFGKDYTRSRRLPELF
jgi:hypothetical protein